MLRRVLRSVRNCCYIKKPCPHIDRIDRGGRAFRYSKGSEYSMECRRNRIDRIDRIDRTGMAKPGLLLRTKRPAHA